MPGIKALRKIQLGVETTAGQAVAATAIWRGLGTIEDRREIKRPDENIGLISGSDRMYTPKLLAALDMDAIPATFEQLPYILSAGVKNVVTGAADGAGTDKIYAYPFSTASANDIKTYTIEGGDNQAAEEMEYSFVQSFKLSGKAGEAWMMSASWLGRQVSTSTFTAALTLAAVEEILFSKTKLYIDAIGGTIGTTVRSNTLLSADITVVTGFIPVFTGDGNLFFTFPKLTEPKITIDLIFEHDTVGAARKTDWVGMTAELFRLKTEGSAVATSGTAFTKKTLQIDFVAKIDKVSKLDEQDGDDILKVSLTPRYNTTAAKFCEITVVNELAALT